MACVALPRAQQPTPQPLDTGRATVLTLAADGDAAFVVHAAAGDLVRVRIDQRGIDVTARVDGPDARTRLQVNSSRRDYGTEVVLFVADASGDYRVIAQPADRRMAGGRLDTRLEARRPATTADAAVVAAMRDFERAMDQRGDAASGTTETRQALLDGLEASWHAFDAVGERWGAARAALELAGAAVTGENWARARAPLSRALDDWAALDDPFALAFVKNLEGLCRFTAGEPELAMTEMQQAFDLARENGDLATASLARNNLGIFHGTLGDAEAAYDDFREALALRQTAGRGTAEHILLTNMARLAATMGDAATARDTYHRARDAARAARQPAAERLVLNNLANLYRRGGDVEGALRLHRESLDLARGLGMPAAEAQALNGIGTDLFELGRVAEAETYQRDALAIRRAIDDLEGQAASQQSLGETLGALGRYDDGLAALHEAFDLRERLADAHGQPAVWRAIGDLERRRGGTAAALTAYEAALAGVERVRDRLTSPALRASFVAREHATYETYVDLLMASAARAGDRDVERQAFEAADRGRARVLLDALLASRVDVRAGVPEALLATERTLQRQVADAGARLSRLLLASTGGRDVAAARDALAAASSDLERHQARLLRESPGYASLVRPEATPLTVVQGELLDDDTVLLEYSLGAERSWLWAVSRDAFHSVSLPGRAAIESAVRTLRDLYESRTPRPEESAATATRRIAIADAAMPAASDTLARVLLDPIADDLGGRWRGKRLAIVTGDALEYIPFAALPMPGTRTPLVAHHEVVYLPSASALRAVRQRHAATPRAPVVAVVADPVFETTDPRLATSVRRRAAPAGLPAPLTRARRGTAWDAVEPAPLSRLAFSRLEASAIARLVPPARLRLVTGFDATRESLTTPGLQAVDILHLATHGLVSAESPALTGLVVSLLDRRGSPRDGFLRLSDIYNLRLRADLVVLSACHTALGKDVRGEGLVGLTRGFMYAGARRVIASLWAVDDSATAALMTRFYRGLLQDHLTPGAALRAAQRDLARQPQWAAPYFWAGFVLQGDWQ